jgi:hypothetical protein
VAKNFKTLVRVYYIQALPEAFWSFAQMIVQRITLIHSYKMKNACGGELRVCDGVVVS